MVSVTDRDTHRIFKQIALISAPWPMFSRPSIQLGVLKGYLKNAFPDVRVFCHHFYLTLAETIEYPIYQALCEDTWLAESIYAALLYPDRQDRISRFFAGKAKKSRKLAGLDFSNLTRRVKTVSDRFIEKTDWRAVDLVGLSVCLCQLTASLYFIREIKRRVPDLHLIAGGSIIGGPTADDLLCSFPEIDLIVTGEGEQPLHRLVSHLQAGGLLDDLPPTEGIVRRKNGRSEASISFCQMADLKNLPMPDFSDYFDLLAEFPEEKRFFPTLPVEASRGCWWQGVKPNTDKSRKPEGCAFCNLNLQWQGYRTKAVAQVVDEVDQLTDTHKVLSVSFMDNALPPKKIRDISAGLASKNKHFQFFGELRASTSRRSLEALRNAGMIKIQIGIESLSSRLLEKLNKGTTAMDNMEIIKHCEALGIQNEGNLLLHFPGSDETDVEETLRTIHFARLFRPLRTVYFWLGMQSPVWKDPRNYGIKALLNHPYTKILFPEPVCRRTRFMVQDYRGDKLLQRRLWRPVEQAVRKWRQDYFRLHNDPYDGPILTLHDGRSFLILRERRIDKEPANHRLEGTSRKIYLFCEHRRPLKQIEERFSPLPPDKIRSFLTMMTDKGLMFEERGEYLSLAVSTRPAGDKIGTTD